MRKAILIPVVALAGGVVGFFLRRWGLDTAFEPDTGLPIAGMPATYVLALLCVVMVVGLLLLSRTQTPLFEGYKQAFDAKGNFVYCVVVIAASAVLCASGIRNIYAYMHHEHDSVLRVLLGLLCFVAVLCILMAMVENVRGTGDGKFRFTLLMPAYTYCLWLISAYQERAVDPVISDYVYQMFAIIASLLGLYFIASFSFGRGRITTTGLFSGLGVYFSVVALADTVDWATRLLLVFSIIFLCAGLGLLFHSRRPTGRRQSQPLDSKIEEVSPHGEP